MALSFSSSREGTHGFNADLWSVCGFNADLMENWNILHGFPNVQVSL